MGLPTVYIAAARKMGTIKLRRAIKKIAPSLPTIVSVIGYPKVGKSSIINALKGKHSASTSPYPGSPGYTRTFQLYRVDPNILMIDTPGILPVEGDTREDNKGLPARKTRRTPCSQPYSLFKNPRTQSKRVSTCIWY